MSELMVFVRTGWMQWYGLTPGYEEVVGGGSYNVENIGGECTNFKPVNGRFFGYVQTGSAIAGFNLERIAHRAQVGKDKSLDNVLVIIIAGSPQVIVGWYRNATLHRSSRELPG